VLKGRATWLEEGKSLVMGNSSPTTIEEELPMTTINSHVYQTNERERTIDAIPAPSIPIPAVDHLENERLLIAMATKRIIKRKLFLTHSIIFLPVAFSILIFTGLLRFDAIFFVVAISIWGIAYGVHGIDYAVSSGKSPSYPKGSNKAKEIADEVAMIKSYLHQ